MVALVFFFSFVADWNNFFLPYVVLADSNAVPDPGRPLEPAGLDAVVQPGRRRRRPAVNIFRPELALATLLAVIPVAIVFLISQRALVRGTLGGAVKQ